MAQAWLEQGMNGAPFALGLVGADGILTLFAGRQAALLHPAPETAVGRTPREAFSHVPAVWRGLESSLAGTDGRTEAEVGGRRFDCSFTSLGDGGAVLMAVDTTDRRRVEAQRDETEARYRGLVERSPDAILVHRDRKILYANPAAADLFGVAGAEDLLGTEVQDLVPPEQKERVQQRIARALDEGAALEPTVQEVLRRDGGVRCVEVRAGPVPFGDGMALQSVLRDITQHRAADERLKLYRQIIAHSSEAIAIIDPTGRYLEQNEAHHNLLGFADADLADRTPAVHLGEEAFAEIADALGRVGVYRGEKVSRTRDGRRLLLDLSAFTVKDRQGRPVCHVGIKRDVTQERRSSEELERVAAQLAENAVELSRRNDELQQFAYIVSHDLREPLRGIAHYIQLLRRRTGADLEDEDASLLTGIEDAARRMERMVDGLHRYLRAGRGTRQEEAKPTDMGDVVDEALKELRLALQESGARVTRDPGLPALHVDPRPWTQVYQNLIGNAVKFCGDATPQIHVGAERTQDGWRFTVADNGIGVPPEQRERIFEVFGRLHSRDQYPGTGVGLAICKKTVEAHGGRIGVEDAPGGGCVFWFTLPDASH